MFIFHCLPKKILCVGLYCVLLSRLSQCSAFYYAFWPVLPTVLNAENLKVWWWKNKSDDFQVFKEFLRIFMSNTHLFSSLKRFMFNLKLNKQSDVDHAHALFCKQCTQYLSKTIKTRFWRVMCVTWNIKVRRKH